MIRPSAARTCRSRGMHHRRSTPAAFFSNATLRNFYPRVGFARDPFMVARQPSAGGFGIFDLLPLP